MPERGPGVKQMARSQAELPEKQSQRQGHEGLASGHTPSGSVPPFISRRGWSFLRTRLIKDTIPPAPRPLASLWSSIGSRLYQF